MGIETIFETWAVLAVLGALTWFALSAGGSKTE